jgi:LL-diaminopimelate aminotransferase
VRTKYERRLHKLVTMLQSCGFDCRMPGGSYFLYCRAPSAAGGQKFANAEGASQHLITQQSIVTVPWDDAGPYIRFSVTYEAADEAAEDALMIETQQRLAALGLVF